MNLRFFKLIILSVILSCAVFNHSCNPSQQKLNKVMNLADDNRRELQKVMDYYENDEEKLLAAKFLISNMEDKYSLLNKSSNYLNEVLSIIDSFRRDGNIHIDLSTKFGQPQSSDRYYDYSTVSASYLISHIDHSFRTWKDNKWARNVSFETFCEYILPYRIGTEGLEQWNERLFNAWMPIVADKHLDSMTRIAEYINDHNARRMSHMRMFWSYPYDFMSSEFELINKGSCRHSAFYTTQTFRALGIPITIDFTRKWAGSGNGHEWNVIFKEDGSEHPFDAIHKGLSIDMSWRKIAKVFRKTFSKQEKNIVDSHIHEIPKGLIDPYALDVTSKYVKTASFTIPLERTDKYRYAIISTYNGFDWLPQDWGEIKNGKALFKDMGTENLYSVFLYENGSSKRMTEPFFLDSLGNVRFFQADFEQKQDLSLNRKTPLTPFMKNIMSFIVGNKIQGGNTRNFMDSTTFFTIEKTPENMQSVVIEDSKKYRYVRMWIPKRERGDIAELEFYGLSDSGKDTIQLSGKIIGDSNLDISKNKSYSYPFDGDLLTYYMVPLKNVDSWVGLDLGKPQQIVKVRYCPRSDTNFIEVGDEYELFLWGSRQWESMGKLKATNQVLIYKDMPSNGLYILVNTTKGNENNIFSYENDRQIWY